MTSCSKTKAVTRLEPFAVLRKGCSTAMTFNPHTDADRAEMLATIGVGSIDELFSPIASDIRFPALDLLPQLTEMEAAARLSELAAKNLFPTVGNTFLGAGSYH